MSFVTDASIRYGATSITVVEASDSAVLSIIQLREQVGQGLSDDDPLLQDYQYAAIGMVSHLIGRPLLVSTVRASYPAVSTTIRLPHPLTSNSTVTMVTVDDEGQSTSVDGVFILEREPVGVLRLGTPLTSLLSPLRVHITYQTGYTPATVPVPLQQAIRLLVSHWYQNRSDASSVAQHQIPFGVRVLCEPYSLRGLVS